MTTPTDESLPEIPDVTIDLSPKALSLGRDQTLEAALRWFDSVKKGR